MHDGLRHLLLQVRHPTDPMREHEVNCFARVLACPPQHIRACDLLTSGPTAAELDDADVVLLGGSGDFSVAKGGPWMDSALIAMRQLHDTAKPTFASCWGFHAMSRAMGGSVVTDPARAEVGTHEIHLTPAGAADPIFCHLGRTFPAQLGHNDTVDRLPEGAILLASSERVENQAFRFAGKPIYCTQFHPELNRELLLDRLRTYPTYVESIVGIPFSEFVTSLTESLETQELLPRFIRSLARTG